MEFIQKELSLPSFSRGFHLVTSLVLKAVPEIQKFQIGQLQIFVKHTSASLTLNENADPTVRGDFERHMNVMVPENQPYYQHTFEGPDDMPAHIKASLMGSSITIPITSGHLNIGIWQGVYLCEHRDHGGSRDIVITAWGKLKNV